MIQLRAAFIILALVLSGSAHAATTDPLCIIPLGNASATTEGAYTKQDRGDAEAYAKYYAGMDKTMRQKVALTTAMFPTEGVVADMGSGSGQASADLAALYPSLKVVGVDVNPKSVQYGREHYKNTNLSFTLGDIADKIFPDASLDGILDSSVLHHVTSFNDFSLARLYQGLDHQAAQLKNNGILVIRDFVAPNGPQTAVLTLPTSGAQEGPVAGLSLAALFKRFARDFKSSIHRQGGVPYKELPATDWGSARFELDHRSAVEFILRKDYRRDDPHWGSELLEEYTYMTQAQFERA